MVDLLLAGRRRLRPICSRLGFLVLQQAVHHPNGVFLRLQLRRQLLDLLVLPRQRRLRVGRAGGRRAGQRLKTLLQPLQVRLRLLVLLRQALHVQVSLVGIAVRALHLFLQLRDRPVLRLQLGAQLLALLLPEARPLGADAVVDGLALRRTGTRCRQLFLQLLHHCRGALLVRLPLLADGVEVRAGALPQRCDVVLRIRQQLQRLGGVLPGLPLR
mmetsp:Transcript_12942/g.33256  ORF Transcript_12942/g.33256 Transcript_12942/m.33256 type:complete len:215 (-) Transcript_12942:675-1319(-)